jgi:uncharacterized protein YkwD
MSDTGPLTLLRLGAFTMLALAAAACSPGGGGGGLSAGLSARMDAPGASLNRAEALGIVNHYRSITGAAALAPDAGLDASAQQLAQAYARSGSPPRRPEGMVAMRASAGYANFADTFSCWRNSPDDAAVLADRNARRGGLGVVYDENSTYGIYWILLLDD